MNILLLAALLSPAMAQSPDLSSCPPLQGLCRRLAAQPVLLPSTGGIVPNPARTEETWTSLTASRNTLLDADALRGRVQPLFESLRRLALRRLAAAGDDSGARQLRRHFERLPLRAEHWARCSRHADPVAASAAGGPPPDVRICPWMSRMDPSALAFILGHELGHHLDPCWHEQLPSPLLAALDRLAPERARVCAQPRDDQAQNEFIEGFADQVGAEMLAALLQEGTLTPPSTSVDLKAAALLQHALQPACGRHAPERAQRALELPAIRQALSCGP
jgi:hypothetical protein